MQRKKLLHVGVLPPPKLLVFHSFYHLSMVCRYVILCVAVPHCLRHTTLVRSTTLSTDKTPDTDSKRQTTDTGSRGVVGGREADEKGRKGLSILNSTLHRLSLIKPGK